MTELPPASRRVQEAATGLGLSIEIRVHETSTRTAEEAAAACGCHVGEIVKSLVFAGAETGEPVLILVSGSNRVDEALAAEVVGQGLVRPDGKSVRAWTGFAIGGIPPFGHAERLRTFMDRDLLQYGHVWAAAGTPLTMFAVEPKRLADAVGAEIVQIA